MSLKKGARNLYQRRDIRTLSDETNAIPPIGVLRGSAQFELAVVLSPRYRPGRGEGSLHLTPLGSYHVPMSDTDPGLRMAQTRWYDGWSRYLALVVAAVALVTTTVVFLTIGKKLGGVGELVTAAIGILGLVVSLQIETLFRVAERAQAREQYGRLLEMMEDYPSLLGLATRALEASVATWKRTTVGLFKTEVVNILAQAEIRLQELAQGRLRRTDGDSRPMLERFADANAFIQAVTDDNDTKWWLLGSGTKFFELNRKLIDDCEVSIERVWILYRPPAEDTRRVLREQHDIGVTVFIVRAEDPGLDRKLLVNMTMVDGLFLHEDLPNKQGKAVEYLYSENAADLVRAGNTFTQLKTSAMRYEDDHSIDRLFETIGAPGGTRPATPHAAGLPSS
jgi:hypothetical protein